MKKSIFLFILCYSLVFKSFSQTGGLDTDDFQGLIDGLIGGINSGMAGRGAAGDLPETPLTLSNQECVPDFSQDLSDDISVSCNEDITCINCFDKAYEKLNFYRRQLARLNCIYTNTKKYKEAAVAFGDNTSGVHAMAGIAWQQQRANIMKTYQTTQTTYDTKSTEFLMGLNDALRKLSTCMDITGENNWYVKSGFIYFEFMQQRYKRID
jgi:hypothetical protein